MSLLSFSLYLGGGLSGIAAWSMFALSYGWKARLYRTQGIIVSRPWSLS
jgi:hypothetical protein